MFLPKVKVAAVHAAPVYMKAQETLEKALAYIAEASRSGAELVVFPESFIPGFPVWAALWAPIHNHSWFEKMAENSLLIDGPEIKALCSAAAHHDILIYMGFSERSPVSVGCLWNSSVLIDQTGQIINHHRKLVPTFYEKMVWAPGDGAGLKVSDTRIGRVGGLICGENTNPLARYSLMAQGEQIHISQWPSIWPTRRPSVGGNFDNLAANHIRASAHSFEAKCFGIMSASVMNDEMKTMLLDWDSSVADILENTPQAATMFVDPTGAPIGDVLQNEEGIASATFDLKKIVEVKQLHDVVGYYNRFDVFNLDVNRRRMVPVTFSRDDVTSTERVAQSVLEDQSMD
ncbi:TPA: carbon-nitrogen hydrolase family protein [Klebsiella michiganensis]|nr:carbon-nitrogen hydrolase family protein [Klebsiella quasipneumoniae]MBZ6572444.1 carbon-nitrogen hydrolase family protein [Klebsiella grimontii]OLU13488.1 aliphatic nitrilase [Klebsiella michiganensis]HBW5067350.1 carbon-nitrogen hydrolase family protein [Klebsiella pneumoniae]MBZ7379408.1 carbon-nitrogen hydrolase family protein [Klebsiella grimontii]WKH77807.1 carbon-nitrogen hydrolase family protein [Klebsiella quasipneumoniae]